MAVTAPKRGKIVKEDPIIARVEKAYSALVLAEETIAASLDIQRKGKKGIIRNLVSAKDIVIWGREMGWIR